LASPIGMEGTISVVHPCRDTTKTFVFSLTLCSSRRVTITFAALTISHIFQRIVDIPVPTSLLLSLSLTTISYQRPRSPKFGWLICLIQSLGLVEASKVASNFVSIVLIYLIYIAYNKHASLDKTELHSTHLPPNIR
jgi:hypothetical protein